MVINTEAEYNVAFERSLRLALTDPEPDSPDGIEFEQLARALEGYERRKYPHLFPDSGSFGQWPEVTPC